MDCEVARTRSVATGSRPPPGRAWPASQTLVRQKVMHRIRKFVEIESGRIGYAMTADVLSEASNGAKWEPGPSFSVTGFVLVSGDKIRGGDVAFAYFGTIKRTYNGFIAELHSMPHSPGPTSVFNVEPVDIQLTGIIDGANAICTGTAKQVPGLIFKAVLTFISE